MPSIGPLELVIILVIVLLIFGPKRLPGLGRQLGSGMREFKDGITGKRHDEDAAEDAALPPAPAQPAEPAEPVRAAAEPRTDDRPPADA